MKVLHVSTTDQGGGAARGAYSLHQALGERLDSGMLVQHKQGHDPRVVQYQPRWTSAISRRLERFALRAYPEHTTDFSPMVLPRPVHRHINALAPDLVNLHWVNDGFLSPESVARIRAPIVWTLRDLWPMTGGCHYPGACQGYTASCGRCPVLHSSREHDLSRRLAQRKARAWAHTPFTLVALSHWLAGQARQSALFAQREVLVVPNALDVRVFKPSDRLRARAAFSLPTDRRIILFGALNPLKDARKGFAEFRAALEVLAAREDRDRLLVVVFGPLYDKQPALPLETRYLGAIRDDARLAELYAAADVTVMPSLEEAFGKVAMESLACGTPAVCFADSGPADIVDHLENGYQARHGDVSDLARAVAWVLDHPNPAALSRSGTEKVLGEYTYEQQASAYERIYRRLLEAQSTRPNVMDGHPSEQGI